MKYVVAVQSFKNLGQRVVEGAAGYEIRSKCPLAQEGIPPQSAEWKIPLGFFALNDVEYSCLVSKMRIHPDGPLPLTADEAVRYATQSGVPYIPFRTPQQAKAVVLGARRV